MRVLSVLLFFVLAAFAGCTEPPAGTLASGEDTNAPATHLVKDGRDLRYDLEETDVIEKPEWKVGDWFGHHVMLEDGPTDGFHINTVVVDDKGDSWLLATDDKQMAKFEAVIDIPIIGPLKKKDLSGTGFGAPWEPYVFPLKHGATWTKEVEVGDPFSGSEMVKVTFEATYNAAISTTEGDRPGFDIVGKTPEGIVALAYDFVPDIQWYAHFYSYKIDTQDPTDYGFHVMSMGRGTAWTGEYYIDTAQVFLSGDYGVVPPAAYADPKPYLAGTVGDEAHYVYGFVYAAAWLGVQETIVVDPDNNRYEFQAVGTDPEEENAAVSFGEIDVAAKPGEWKVIAPGAGGAAVWGISMWHITETAKAL